MINGPILTGGLGATGGLAFTGGFTGSGFGAFGGSGFGEGTSTGGSSLINGPILTGGLGATGGLAFTGSSTGTGFGAFGGSGFGVGGLGDGGAGFGGTGFLTGSGLGGFGASARRRIAASETFQVEPPVARSMVHSLVAVLRTDRLMCIARPASGFTASAVHGMRHSHTQTSPETTFAEYPTPCPARLAAPSFLDASGLLSKWPVG